MKRIQFSVWCQKKFVPSIVDFEKGADRQTDVPGATISMDQHSFLSCSFPSFRCFFLRFLEEPAVVMYAG